MLLISILLTLIRVFSSTSQTELFGGMFDEGVFELQVLYVRAIKLLASLSCYSIVPHRELDNNYIRSVPPLFFQRNSIQFM